MFVNTDFYIENYKETSFTGNLFTSHIYKEPHFVLDSNSVVIHFITAIKSLGLGATGDIDFIRFSKLLIHLTKIKILILPKQMYLYRRLT